MALYEPVLCCEWPSDRRQQPLQKGTATAKRPEAAVPVESTLVRALTSQLSSARGFRVASATGPPAIEPSLPGGAILLQGGDPILCPTSAFLSNPPLQVILSADQFRLCSDDCQALGCRVRSAVCNVHHFSASADGGQAICDGIIRGKGHKRQPSRGTDPHVSFSARYAVLYR